MATAPNKKSDPVSSGDRIALILFIVAGTIIAAWMTVTAILRISNLAGGVDVPVMIEFIDQDVEIATNGVPTSVAIDRGTITADVLPTAAIVPGILGQITMIVTVIIIVASVILLSRSILRGRVFSRRNTCLVMLAGMSGLAGVALARLFDSMLANATVATIAPDLRHALMTVEPFPFVLAAFIIATVGCAFSIGDRLQRDTEGLV